MDGRSSPRCWTTFRAGLRGRRTTSDREASEGADTTRKKLGLLQRQGGSGSRPALGTLPEIRRVLSGSCGAAICLFFPEALKAKVGYDS